MASGTSCADFTFGRTECRGQSAFRVARILADGATRTGFICVLASLDQQVAEGACPANPPLNAQNPKTKRTCKATRSSVTTCALPGPRLHRVGNRYLSQHHPDRFPDRTSR